MTMSKAARWRIPFAPSAPQQQPQAAATKQDPLVPLSVLPDAKQFGLENFGSTCYANSVLQALYFCAPFRDLVVQSVDSSSPPVPKSFPRTMTALSSPGLAATRRKSDANKHPFDAGSTASTFTIPISPPTLFSALRSLYVFISTNPQERGAVAPRAFIDKLRELNELFRSNMHQDAHEFLNYLLNQITEEIQKDQNHKDSEFNASGSGEDLSTSIATLSSTAPTTAPSASGSSHHVNNTFIHQLFEGVLTSETRCLTCETVSSRDEAFLDLSIDIEQNSSVTACLRQFSASEMLCQKNKFFCDSCCGLQEAEKRMKIKKLPNVLALHLKRFKYQDDVQKYIKLSYRVAFPLELRLFNTVDDAENPDRLYELFSVVVHIGSGPHHGHYVTLVKGPLSWLLFDDDKIETLKESEIPKYFGDSPCGSAYVLYYQAVDIDLPALGLKLETFAAAAAVAPTLTNGVPVPADTSGDGIDSVELTPALPPGLVSADAGSDTSHSSPLLGTPSPVLSGIPPKIFIPALRVDTASIPSEQPASPTDSAGRRSDKSQHVSQGLSNGMRTCAEEKIAAASNEAARRSLSKDRSLRRPSTAPVPQSPLGRPRGKDKEDTTPIPPVPALPHVLVNGKEAKEKEPDRKPSIWFKRRSLKSEKDKDKKDKLKDKSKDVMMPASPTSPAFSPLISPRPSQSTPTAAASKHTSHSDLQHPPSSSALPPNPSATSIQHSNSSLLPLQQSLAVAPSAAASLESQARRSTQGTDSISATSSVASSSSNVVSSSRSHPPPSQSPPSIPGSPNTTQAPTPTLTAPPKSPSSTLASPPPPSPVHKRSAIFRRKHGSASARPSTAHASTSTDGRLSRLLESPSVAPPVSAVAHIPSSPVTSDVSDGPATDSEALHPAAALSRSGSWRRPRSVHGHGLGLGGVTGKASPLHHLEQPPPPPEKDRGREGDRQVSASPLPKEDKGLKRAARKLSFSAPMFGFGKKDREEKKARTPPNAFAAAAAMSMAAR